VLWCLLSLLRSGLYPWRTRLRAPFQLCPLCQWDFLLSLLYCCWPFASATAAASMMHESLMLQLVS
jgi:hypothetical protein